MLPLIHVRDTFSTSVLVTVTLTHPNSSKISTAVVLVVNDCGSSVSYPITFDGTSFTFATRTATSLEDLVR